MSASTKVSAAIDHCTTGAEGAQECPLSHAAVFVWCALHTLALEQERCRDCGSWTRRRSDRTHRCDDCARRHRQQLQQDVSSDAAASCASAVPSAPPPHPATAAPLQLLAVAAASRPDVESSQYPVPPSRKRKYASHSDDLRASVAHLHERGLSWSQVEETTGMPRSSAQDVARLQRTEGRTSKRHKGGNHKPVISDAVRQLITALQNADASLRLQDIRSLLDVVCLGSPPCLNTIWRIEQAAGFTTKQMQAHAAPRNTLATKEKRAASRARPRRERQLVPGE